MTFFEVSRVCVVLFLNPSHPSRVGACSLPHIHFSIHLLQMLQPTVIVFIMSFYKTKAKSSGNCKPICAIYWFPGLWYMAPSPQPNFKSCHLRNHALYLPSMSLTPFLMGKMTWHVELALKYSSRNTCVCDGRLKKKDGHNDTMLIFAEYRC